MLIRVCDHDGIADRWKLAKLLFNFCRGDQDTVEFLGIICSTQNMQEPVFIQTTQIAGLVPSLLKASETKARVVTISARHGRRPHLDNPDFSGIHQTSVSLAKSYVDSWLNAAGGSKGFRMRQVMIDGREHAYDAHFACAIDVRDDRTEPLASP